MGLSLENVIALDIDDEDVLARLGGRRTCPNCGEIFHIQTRPAKKENICDKCGSTLIIRPDDQPDTIREFFIETPSRSRPITRRKGS
jgi:adenylate kinase